MIHDSVSKAQRTALLTDANLDLAICYTGSPRAQQAFSGTVRAIQREQIPNLPSQLTFTDEIVRPACCSMLWTKSNTAEMSAILGATSHLASLDCIV